MPLFKLIVMMSYTAYVAWWAPRLMSQLRYIEDSDSGATESVMVDWFIDRMMPKILWAIYLTMSNAMLTASDNATAFVYLMICLCVSVFLLIKPHQEHRQ